MENNPQVGTRAPDFIANAVYKNEFETIKLSDYRGKKFVILLFYPLNFTSLPTTELIKFNNRIDDFKKLSTQILAISIDSQFSHFKWVNLSKENGGLSNLGYPLISDVQKKIASDFNILNIDGVALPSVFIIDKEGIIQYSSVNNMYCGRSTAEILRVLNAIQYVQKNSGQACPVDWEIGNETISINTKKFKTQKN